MRYDVGFVEAQHQRQTSLVENRTGVHHVRHERRRRLRARRVDDINNAAATQRLTFVIVIVCSSHAVVARVV